NVLVANTYDAAGRVSTQTNGRGLTTTFSYGVPRAGDTSIIDPRGETTIHVYDEQLRIAQIIDALGNAVDFGYDTANNRTSVIDQNGHTTLFGYDGQGNVTRITDALGNITLFTYDAQNNRTSATNATGATTTFGYATPGNLSSIRDALGN